MSSGRVPEVAERLQGMCPYGCGAHVIWAQHHILGMLACFDPEPWLRPLYSAPPDLAKVEADRRRKEFVKTRAELPYRYSMVRIDFERATYQHVAVFLKQTKRPPSGELYIPHPLTCIAYDWAYGNGFKTA